MIFKKEIVMTHDEFLEYRYGNKKEYNIKK